MLTIRQRAQQPATLRLRQTKVGSVADQRVSEQTDLLPILLTHQSSQRSTHLTLSKLLDARQAAELRTAVDDVLQRAEGWRAPTREPGDGPPGPEALLLIVLRHYQRRSENTRALYARELVLFLAHCQSRGQDPYAVRSAQIEDYLALLGAAGLAEASRALALAAIAAYYRRAVHERAIDRDLLQGS